MRTKTGVVTSTKMQKTIVVTIDSYKTHPKYQKRYKSSRKFYAHDEQELAREGDIVTISETRPLSATKHWILVENSIQTVNA